MLLAMASLPVLAAAASRDNALELSLYTEHFFIYYAEGRRSEAKATARLAEQCWGAVTGELGLAPQRRVRLFLADSQAQLEALCGGPETFWLAGRARPHRSVIIVRLRGTERERQAVLAHELVHVALGQALEPHGVRPPQWLMEGLSEYIADAVTPGDQRRRASGQPMPISALHRGFPSQPHRSTLAYAQSRSFVQFLIGETGDKGLRRLVQALRETGDIEKAFSRVYGRSLAQFEAAWQPRFAMGLGRAPRIDPALAIFMAMSALFVLVCLIRIIRRRLRRRPDWLEEADDEGEYDEFGDEP